MSDYPKLLYRHNPEAERIDGVHCDIMAVNDAAEEKAAVGWHDTVAAAAPKARSVRVENLTDDDLDAVRTAKPRQSKSVDDPRPALRKEYEALSGKKAFGGWNAEQLGEKIAALKTAP